MLIVLAAGFIGQFGKRLADHLIARSRRRRALKQSSTAQDTDGLSASEPADSRSLLPGPTPGVQRVAIPDKTTAKTAKKVAKKEVKRAKKARDPGAGG